jgi:hypothetical protein
MYTVCMHTHTSVLLVVGVLGAASMIADKAAVPNSVYIYIYIYVFKPTHPYIRMQLIVAVLGEASSIAEKVAKVQ